MEDTRTLPPTLTHTERERERERERETRSHTGCMDTYNFPPWNIATTDAKRIANFPFFHEHVGPGRIQDNLDYFTQIEGNDAFPLSQE